MVLQTQTIPFQFSAGLNSKVDEFELPAPQLLQADNVRFQLDGAISKRPGMVALSNRIINGGYLTSGVACQVFDNELLAFDGTYIYSYVESVDAWINRGLAISVINNQLKVFNSRVAQQNNPDGTNLNGQELYIWEDTRGNPLSIRYSLLDSNTGSFIVSDSLINNGGAEPKVIAIPNLNQFNLYYCSSFNILNLQTINTERPNIISPIKQIILDGAGTIDYLSYDACLYNNNPLVAYASQDGYICTVYENTTTQIANVGTSVLCVSVVASANNNFIWIAYSTTSGTFIILLNSLTTGIPIQLDTNLAFNIGLIEDINIGAVNMTWEVGTHGNDHLINNVIIQNNKTILFQWTQRGVGLVSKPFRNNNQLFINTIFQSKNQSTYFTLCLTQNASCISKMNPGVAGTYRDNGLLAQCDIFPGTNEFLFANQKKGAFTTNDNTSYSLLGVNVSYLDFSNVDAFNSVVASNNLHIVGGVEKIYDKISIVEDNFHLYAEEPNGTGSTIVLQSGGNLQTGQYQYFICYEWTDNYGQVERGQPSLPTIVNAAAGQAAFLTIPTLRITDKDNPRSPVSIAIFRNIIVSGVPGDQFLKITSDANPLVNNVNVDSVTFLDITSDVEIGGNEPLYTSSQLFNSAPPACSLISAYQTRVFLSGLEDPNVIWTSQDRFELDNYNTIPIEFSPLLIEGVDSTGEAITAIRALDQAMIIFKANTIFWFNGSGPNANGTSGGFSDATPIPSDAGCTNPNSIIAIPGNQFNSGGLMYQSSKGIYLIDRSYVNQYIGAQVEKYNNLHITSAELLDDANEVLFITLEGVVLCYNYFFNRWSTWSYLPAVDSCIWNNKLVMIQANGNILVQQEGYYADYDSASPTKTRSVVRKVQIPWLAFAGMQGFQACYYVQIIGHYISPHLLNMSVCYNYDPAPKEPVSINSNLVSNTFGSLPTFGAAATFGGGAFTPYQFQYNFGYPWGQSISLIITDTPLDDTNQGAIWTALNFSVGIFNDPVRLPARNKVSGTKSIPSI